MSQILAGKTAIVTGSTRGIGRAIALRFAREGARVVVNGTNPERGEAVLAELTALGAEAQLCLGDVSSPGFARQMAEFAKGKFGSIDIFVSNAGPVSFEPFLTMSGDTWRRFLDIHVSGAFYCGQAAANLMVDGGRGGRIINMASVAGNFGLYGFTAYSTVKGALMSLTRVQAVELAEHGITANAIAPGPVWNEMMEGLWGPERLEERCKTIPMGRLARADEVASLAVFLASAEAAYITGQTYVLDGGASAAGLYAHEVFKRASPAR
jgi:3-oxoacyl-[acyl-carrier protein] reductase